MSHRSKAKKLHIYPFMAEVMWVKWQKDLSAQRRWKALIWCERKDKIGKNVNMLNFTSNSRLCFHHFDKEKIGTDGNTRGDPVYFVWNNWRKLLVWKKDRKVGMDIMTSVNIMIH